MFGNEDEGKSRRRRRYVNRPETTSYDAARLMRKIAWFFPKCAEERGAPIIRVRNTPDSAEGVARRIAEAVRERRADPSIRASGAPIVVEVVASRRRAARQEEETLEKQAEKIRHQAEMIRKAWERWQHYRKEVDDLEEAGNREPKDGVVLHAKYVVAWMQGAYRVLHERFGVRATGRGVVQLRERVRLVMDEAHVNLDDAEEVAAFVDAWWRFRTMDDARVALNRALEEGRRHGDGGEEAARAACTAVVHVLRARPMTYGVFALGLDWLEREPSGLRKARQAAADVLSGWVRTQLKLSPWFEDEQRPDGEVITKVGANELRIALEDLAEGGERVSQVLLRELGPATLAEWERLMRAVGEEVPEQAMRKWALRERALWKSALRTLVVRKQDLRKLVLRKLVLRRQARQELTLRKRALRKKLGLKKLGHTSLRNLVARHIQREGGQQHELGTTGDLAEPAEIADPEVEDFAAREAAREQIRVAFAEAGLSPREREVLILRKIAGMGTREIADHLGLAEKTVYTYDLRADEKLARYKERRDASA